MRILAETPGPITGDTLQVVQRADGSVELVRLAERGRRVASLGLTQREVDDLVEALLAASEVLRLDRRGAVAGTRTAGPPVVDLEEIA